MEMKPFRMNPIYDWEISQVMQNWKLALWRTTVAMTLTQENH